MFKLDHPAERMTFLELYEQYRISRLSNKLSTKIAAKNIAENRILPFFADKVISEITLNTIAQWHSCFYEDDGSPIFSQTYLRTMHANLSAILNYAVKCGWLVQNPASSCSIGAKNAEERPVWTLEEYSRFRKEIKDDMECLCAFDTLYFTGVRRGELLALNIGDVDFEKKTISITKSLQRFHGVEYITSPKTKTSVRKFRISQMLSDELHEYVQKRGDPEMGTRLFTLTASKLTMVLKKCGDNAGLDHIPIHSMRHSHITNLIAEGYSPVDIAKRVGHESIYITLQYSHAFKDVENNIAESLDKEMMSVL